MNAFNLGRDIISPAPKGSLVREPSALRTLTSPGAAVAATFSQLRYTKTRRKLNPPLGFIHMPKAGGTSLVTEVAAVLRPLVHVGGIDRSQTGDFGEFHSMKPGMRQSIFLKPEEIPGNADLIAGHFARSTLLVHLPDIKLMTILREPRSRIISHWFYLAGYGDDVLALYGGWGKTLALARRSLLDFIDNRSIASHTDNLMTRMLLWPHPLIPNADFIDPVNDAALTIEALIALSRVDFADILANPRLHERIRTWLRQSYGQPVWSHLERKLNGGRPAFRNAAKLPAFGVRQSMESELTAECQALLDHRSRLDMVLWRAVAMRTMPTANTSDLASQIYGETVIKIDKLIRSAKPTHIATCT